MSIKAILRRRLVLGISALPQFTARRLLGTKVLFAEFPSRLDAQIALILGSSYPPLEQVALPHCLSESLFGSFPATVFGSFWGSVPNLRNRSWISVAEEISREPLVPSFPLEFLTFWKKNFLKQDNSETKTVQPVKYQ